MIQWLLATDFRRETLRVTTYVHRDWWLISITTFQTTQISGASRPIEDSDTDLIIDEGEINLGHNNVNNAATQRQKPNNTSQVSIKYMWLLLLWSVLWFCMLPRHCIVTVYFELFNKGFEAFSLFPKSTCVGYLIPLSHFLDLQ